MAIPLGAILTGVQAGMGFLSNLFGFGGSSAPSNKIDVKGNKELYKYQSDLDMKNYLKQMQVQSQYQDKYLSNSAMATQNLNQRLMDYQYGLERMSRQTSFQDTRKDLESAGYNPILAVGQQSNYVPVSSGVSAQSAAQEQMGIASQGGQMALQAMQSFDNHRSVNSAIKSSDFDNMLKSAQANLASGQSVYQGIINSIEQEFGSKIKKAELDGKKQEVINLKEQEKLIKAQIGQISFQNDLMNAQTVSNSAQAGLASSETAKNNEMIRALQTQNDLDTMFAGQAKRHPYLFGLSRLGVLPALSGIATSLVGAGSHLYGQKMFLNSYSQLPSYKKSH